MSGPAYRPDIDGLRALAVLAVLVHHLEAAWLPGGFVGVDIFFVISGYLITRNIHGEMAEGRFSLGQFYLRRIRRIAPAFLVMTAATLLAGTFLLLPADLERLAASALAGVLASANIYFWHFLDDGYFAESAAEEPLLHTWSLGVEEQFYFLWPFLLLLLMRAPHRRGLLLATTVVLGVASFAAAEWWAATSPKFAFYMLPARAGELMVGALLALNAREVRGSGGGWATELLAATGLALVGFALLWLDPSSRFPGINALYPCLGTALLILVGRDSRLVAWVFTPRPVVAIGLVSYSLYLWHWPVLAYLRYVHGNVPLVQMGWAVLAIAVLSVASYFFVEKPARRWRAGAARQVFALYGLPGAMLAGLSWWLLAGAQPAADGRQPTAAEDAVARIEKQTAAAPAFRQVCQISKHDPGILEIPRCVVGSRALRRAGEEPRVLLWGDSNASHHVGVLAAVANHHGFIFRNAAHASCPPVFGGDFGTGRFQEGCRQFQPLLKQAILAGRYRTVALGGSWDVYFSRPGFREELESTLDQMQAAGLRVVLLGNVPRFPGYRRRCELQLASGEERPCRRLSRRPDRGESKANRTLRAIADARDGVEYLSVHAVLCRDGTCEPYLRGQPLYYDSGHLSMAGSRLIGRIIVKGPAREDWVRAFVPPEGL